MSSLYVTSKRHWNSILLWTTIFGEYNKISVPKKLTQGATTTQSSKFIYVELACKSTPNERLLVKPKTNFQKDNKMTPQK